MISLYFIGIFIGIFCALLFKKTIFKGEAVPFVMELPHYRAPAAKNVAHLLWDKIKDFAARAFTVIFLASIIVWFMQSFDFGLNRVSDSSDSMLATIGGAAAPLMAPLGLNDWKISTALFTGFIAKESVVSTLNVLYESNAAIEGPLGIPEAAALLVFCLLYTPCVAAIAAVKRELGAKWTAGVVLWQCGIAWLIALAVKITASSFM